MAGSERINIRATPEEVERLKRAAQVKRMSLTMFMLRASLRLADLVLGEKDNSVDAE